MKLSGNSPNRKEKLMSESLKSMTIVSNILLIGIKFGNIMYLCF
jgi:hypothetical protein